MKKRILGTLGAAMAAMAVFVTPLHRAGAVEQNAAAGEDPAVLAEEIALGNIFLFPDEPAAASDVIPVDNPEPASEPAVTEARAKEEAQVRSGASDEAEAVFTMHQDETVQVLEQADGWCKVSYGIIEGYLPEDQLFVLTQEGYDGTVMKDGAVIRQAAEAEAAEVGKLYTGNGVRVMDYQNGCYKVSYKDAVGYVEAASLKLEGDFTAEAEVRYLKSGMSGEAVVRMQKELASRNYFTGEATGTFGDLTVKALKEFQTDAKVTASGEADAKTLELLYADNGIKKVIPTPTPKPTQTPSTGGSSNVPATQVKGKVQLVDWSIINRTIPRGYTGLQVIDVRTGISFNAKRKGGTVHMDTEPLTAADTAKLKQAYGGSWSWARRPVWVVYNGNYYAASMNGMPHADSTISDNNFPGHICIHFLNSETHAEPGIPQKVDPAHQACVQEAFNAGK
ncbi:MAG: hypothetical protein DBY42_07250 [Bacillota bacterium]|nr:MAG: hypothetical protein DBY42_07250 [Bacillota bacterium]